MNILPQSSLLQASHLILLSNDQQLLNFFECSLPIRTIELSKYWYIYPVSINYTRKCIHHLTSHLVIMLILV